MTDSSFLAHIAEDGRVERVSEHLLMTAEIAKEFASHFGAEDQGQLAGMAHDIGKYSDAFQRRLHGSAEQVDHSTAGALECARLRQNCAAFAVAGHHAGLPNGGTKGDGSEQPTMLGRMKRKDRGLLEDYSRWKNFVELPSTASVPDFLTPQSKPSPIDYDFFIRMLYSCLVDADFLSTETFMKGCSRDRKEVSIEDMEANLQKYIEGWFPPQNQLNRMRCKILNESIRKGREEAPGLFTMTVPTGGGKTVSSLAFALAQAKAKGLRRIIYVVPYTSIIDQNAKVFREILGEDAVLEHHSGVLYDIKNEADPRTIRMAEATENWDMPVIVTTAVQFFESLYANRSSKCRKLHNLAESVIVFDEAQMLPLAYLRPCVSAIAQLVKHYRVSAVLCTATQPALDDILREFLPDLEIKEICPEEIIDSPIFKRVTFQREGKLSWDQVAERMNKEKQVLCIVNTKKGAREVFNRLEGEGCYHLSTLMYPAHRVSVIETIRTRLKEGLSCRVVSTSLIEAGVDVDFPTVYRELAGLDSVLQAAGRCNREGKRGAGESFVTVFESNQPIPHLFSRAAGAARSTMDRHRDFSSPEAIRTYFLQLLQLNGEEAQDEKHVLPTIKKEFFPFQSIADRVRLIDNKTRTVYIPLGEGAELIEKLCSGENNRALYRRLGRYGVAVYENQFSALEMAGAIETLEDGSAILIRTELYSEKTGLLPEQEDSERFFL